MGPAALALTGCGPGSGDDADGAAASPAAKGAVTAAQILDNYETVNNKANSQQDADLLGTVEGGQLYEQSKADFRLFVGSQFGCPFLIDSGPRPAHGTLM